MEEIENPDRDKKISEEVARKVSEIKKASGELEEVRKSCKHSDYDLKNIGPSEGKTFSLKRICKVCSQDLGYASPDEVEKWMSE